MPRSVLEARTADVRRISRDFEALIEHYGKNSLTEAQQLDYINVFEQALYDITASFSRLNIKCPVGFTECPGGGCVSRGRVCPDRENRME